MGQGMPRAPCGGLLHERRVVAVDEAAKVAGRGSLAVSSRYTSKRALEQDFVVSAKVLGTGMSGAVRLATGLRDGKQYAVKSFRKTGTLPEERAELKNETEVYLALDHPHVASLEMVYETHQDVHLVMEHMAGGELYDRLAKRKRYLEAEAAEAARQMLLAVAYLHAHGIAHRDIKLENFLYVSPDSNHLKLIDFGFAKFTDKSSNMSQACGSTHYVAPEVLAKSYTEKADMWSMGVVVYMILTGSPPFFGSDTAVLKKIRRGDVYWSTRFKALSKEAQDFIKALLVVDPAQRLSAQEALEHPWIKGASAAKPAAVEVSTLEGLKRFSDAPKFRRSVLSMMAWASSGEEARKALREQFLSIDTDRSGTISAEELRRVLSQRFQMEDAEADHLFRMLDTDGSQEIEFSEFLAAVSLGQMQAEDLDVDVLQKTFSRLDRNGDGAISREELKFIFGDSFSNGDIDAVLSAADTSGDGKLDYDEFLAHFKRESSVSTSVPTPKSGGTLESLETPPTLESLPEEQGRQRQPRSPVLLGRGGRHPMLGGMRRWRDGWRSTVEKA